MVRESHIYTVAWLRGYATFLSIFSTHVTVTSVTWLRLRLRRHMVRESHIQTVAWLRGYAVTWLRNFFINFFNSRSRNQRNLVTVTVTQTHGERVTHLHSSLVTWLRGYVVTQIFQTTFLSNFSTHVTVT